MYSRQQASQLRQEFWTAFEQYMSPVMSDENECINWINYRTGQKHIYFRMQVDSRHTSIAIELTHPDKETRALYFARLKKWKHLLEEITGEQWTWASEDSDEQGKRLSRIFIQMQEVSVMNKSDWPKIISFLKPRIIALDAFWSQVKEGLRFEV